MGHRDNDCYFFITDRKKDMLLVNGINVYPREIEVCLYEHPQVLEAVCFALRSPRHGDIPVAAVRVSTPVTADEIIGFARERLGPRHPRRVLVLEDYPRNALGKPLIGELRRIMCAPE